MTPDLRILMVGGGLSGMSAALHLARAGVDDFYVLEAERIGQGGNRYLTGTPGPVFPEYTKMVLTPDDRGYTYLSRRFNRQVARNLLRVKRRGVELQVALAAEFDPRARAPYGTLIVGEPDDDRRLREEHRVMRDLGIDADIESYDAARIEALYGTRAGQVRAGPVRRRRRDRRLHALRAGDRARARRDALPRACARNRAAPTRPAVEAGLENGESVTAAARRSIATNGFIIDRDANLAGQDALVLDVPRRAGRPRREHAERLLLRPARPLLVAPGRQAHRRRRGHPRGRRQLPRPAGRRALCGERLARWCGETFPRLAGRGPLALHYSVFGETRDNLPILGRFAPHSRIWYVVGDNGDGQSTLTCIARLLPRAMGLTPAAPRSRRSSLSLPRPRKPEGTGCEAGSDA